MVNRPKPAISQTPDSTTYGSAARVMRSPDESASGNATAATPTTRAGSTAQATGSVAPIRPVAYRLTPNASAAAIEKINGRVPSRIAADSRTVSREIAASRIPAAMTASGAAAPGEMLSPAMTAITAAIAPSVETKGAIAAVI